MICANCGEHFDRDDVRSKFNHYYSGSSNWDYDSHTPGNLCFDCAEDYCETAWMDGDLDADDGPPPEDLAEQWRNRERF